VHQMACQYNLLHFSKTDTGRAGGSDPSSASRYAMIGEKIDGVVWIRLTLPPDTPTQALTRLEGAPARLSILRLPGEVTI
jgi:hypothetical protein